MKNYKKEIDKHEQKIRQLKAEQARQIDATTLEKIHQAFDMGFNVKHVSEAFGIDKHEVRLVQKRRATNKRVKTGVVRDYTLTGQAKWKLIQKRGTPEWAEYIRKGHQGELPTRTLVSRCQEVHDRERICPFCFKNEWKLVIYELRRFPNNASGQIAYLEWNKKRQYKQNLEDFPEGRFPRYVARDKSAIQTTDDGDKELPPEIEVQINGHPLTEDEFQAIDKPDEEIQNDATQLLAEDELVQRSERKGLFQKVKDKIQKPHHSAIHRRRDNKDLEMKAKDLDSATLKRLAEIKEADEARTKGKEEGQ